MGRTIAVGVQINGCSEFSTQGEAATRGIAVEQGNMDSFSIASLKEGALTVRGEIQKGNKAVLVVPNDKNRTPNNPFDFGELALRWVNQNYPDIRCERANGRIGNNAISDVQCVAEHAVKMHYDFTIMIIFAPAIAEYFKTICRAVKLYELPEWEYRIKVADSPEATQRWWKFYRKVNNFTKLMASNWVFWHAYVRFRDWHNRNRNKAFYRTLHEIGHDNYDS